MFPGHVFTWHHTCSLIVQHVWTRSGCVCEHWAGEKCFLMTHFNDAIIYFRQKVVFSETPLFVFFWGIHEFISSIVISYHKVTTLNLNLFLIINKVENELCQCFLVLFIVYLLFICLLSFLWRRCRFVSLKIQKTQEQNKKQTGWDFLKLWFYYYQLHFS